jgi:hypothetical protein
LQVLTEPCNRASYSITPLSEKFSDRERSIVRIPHDQALEQITEFYSTNEHPTSASQSSVCELGSLALARWPKTMAREERRGVERKEDTLTDAQALVWTAWRGSARAAG